MLDDAKLPDMSERRVSRAVNDVANGKGGEDQRVRIQIGSDGISRVAREIGYGLCKMAGEPRLTATAARPAAAA